MPFKSQAQRAFMHARHPEIAKRWEKHTPKGKKLPKYAKKKHTLKDEFEHNLDMALGLVIESDSLDSQASTSPALGASQTVVKGQSGENPDTKKKANSKKTT